jgi:hypothetical protein
MTGAATESERRFFAGFHVSVTGQLRSVKWLKRAGHAMGRGLRWAGVATAFLLTMFISA